MGAARRGVAARGAAVQGGIDSRVVYVNLADVAVRGRFTPDGKPHRTCEAAFGAAFAAGSTEDGGGGLPVFHEGGDGGNPLFDAISDVLGTASPELKECHGRKEILFPAGSIDVVQQRLPVQLFRMGQLYVVGIPAEVTIVSGLRLRRAVAAAVGTGMENVLVQGYANAYAHYVTTPQEYDVQNYEGASTLFGRYELPAFMQVADRLGRAMRAGEPVPLGTKERDRSSEQVPSPQGQVTLDEPLPGTTFGDVVTAPRARYSPGQRVVAVFSGAHPNNRLRHQGTYLTVDRLVGGVLAPGGRRRRLVDPAALGARRARRLARHRRPGASPAPHRRAATGCATSAPPAAPTAGSLRSAGPRNRSPSGPEAAGTNRSIERSGRAGSAARSGAGWGRDLGPAVGDARGDAGRLACRPGGHRDSAAGPRAGRRVRGAGGGGRGRRGRRRRAHLHRRRRPPALLDPAAADHDRRRRDGGVGRGGGRARGARAPARRALAGDRGAAAGSRGRSRRPGSARR